MKKHEYNPYFDDKEEGDFYCPICDRLTPEKYQEEHHLVPKARKGRDTATVCVSCGDMIHQVFTVKELEKTYNTIEKIKTHPKMVAWTKWMSKRPDDFSVCMKKKKRR